MVQTRPATNAVACQSLTPTLCILYAKVGKRPARVAVTDEAEASSSSIIFSIARIVKPRVRAGTSLKVVEYFETLRECKLAGLSYRSSARVHARGVAELILR